MPRGKLAYGENLYLLRTFMWDMKSLGYGQNFDSGKYNRLVLAFEPKFAEYAGQLAQEKCALFRDDEHFVGYYLDNELPFVAYEHSSVTSVSNSRTSFRCPTITAPPATSRGRS